MRLTRNLTALALLGALLAVSALASAADPPRPGRVQVICVTALGSKTGQPKSRYQRRPGDCRFHKLGTPVIYGNTVRLLNIEWTSWLDREALGVGDFYANTSGPVRANLRLSRPITECGHRVFSLARFTFKHIETARPGLFVDRRAPGRRCR